MHGKFHFKEEFPVTIQTRLKAEMLQKKKPSVENDPHFKWQMSIIPPTPQSHAVIFKLVAFKSCYFTLVKVMFKCKSK